MEPLTSYIICTNPRSGSWLLAAGLESTSVAGRPHEWFNEATEEEERQRGGMPPLEGGAYAWYLARIKQVGTSANGVFGLKLMHYQFAQLPQKLSALPSFTDIAAKNILTTVFPNVKHLWLTRRDKVRQAISHCRACQTDQWWRIGEERPPRRPGTVEEPCFDAEAIAQFERQAIANDLAWERYFQQAGLTPLVIVYEDLAADYVGVLRRVLGWLGVPEAQTVALAPPRLNKQADAITEEWVRRYLASRKGGNFVEEVVHGEAEATDARDNQGIPVRDLARPARVAVSLPEALPWRSDLAVAHDNRQAALAEQERLAQTYHNLGVVRLQQGNLEAALVAYEEALRLQPDLAVTRANRAGVWLLQGDFERGWPEYERYCRSKEAVPRVFEQPRWQGEPLAGRTILLYAEHGLGDTLHLIRYASLVRQRGGVVLAEVQPALVPLLRSCAAIDRVLPVGAALPDFDVQAPLLSLPRLFHTTLETVPAEVPYLSVQASRVERWGQELRSLSGFKIGIVWQGDPRYLKDRQRSIPLKHFAVLAALPAVRLVSLQKGFGREQLAAVARHWGVVDFGDRLDESGGAFLDTAALMGHLDLVITPDTAIAHLAGALARPVWLALPAVGDWRWLTEREDSPWYPTMRLFRQKRWDDWDEVFNLIAQALRQQQPATIGCGPLADAATLRKQGRQLCEQGQYAEAITCLRQALRLRPDSAPLYNNLAVALTRQGQLEEAIDVCRQALQLRPHYAEAHHNLGEALQQQSKLGEAQGCYEEALRLKPSLVAAHNSLGVMLAAQGDLPAACRCYREALRLQPDFAVAHHNLAVALEKQGEVREACRHYQHALQGRHDTPAAYLRLGEERARQERFAEAVASYRLALRLQPEHAESWLRLGRVLVQQGTVEEAIGCFEAALRLRPEDAELLVPLGDALRRLGRLSEAESCYRRALRRQPNSAYLHNHLGITLLEQSRPAEAESCFRDGITHKADHAPAHNNLGVALEQQGRLGEAIIAYQESLRLDPDCADTHKNLALARLLGGDFARGWPEYEWRWKCAKAGRRSLTRPRWDGSPLEGRTILLYAEQGLGDTLQFIRYASLVRRQGGVVLAEVQPALVPLLRRCPGIDQLLPSGAPLPDYDMQAPLLSLPGLLHTTLETVPAEVPYLSADPVLVERWQEEVRGVDGFKIGIAWQGSRKYIGDKHRSIPLPYFAPLARLPGVRLVSLQKGHGREQLAAVARDWNIIDLADRLDEGCGAFIDTAAMMQHLDLVVTADTAIAHLAGALAVPVWVALPVARDWRWLLEREDSPWYPTMRLFRQKRFGDWDEVFHRVAQAIQDRQARAALRQRLVVEISVGELLDKITILEIKRARLADAEQRQHVCIELGALQAARARVLQEPAEMAALVQELKRINERLWEVEEELRQHEQRQDFGPSFVQLARSVYQLNDQRAQRKRRLNILCGALLIEEKSYAGSAAAESGFAADTALSAVQSTAIPMNLPFRENIRLVIWDLDQTFWSGTLTEGDVAWVDEHESIVKTLAARGIVSSICSKNDFDPVMAILKSRDLDSYFIFLSIDWSLKGNRIKAIIDNAQLRAETVLFLDDNHLDRAEASQTNPGINVACELFIPHMLTHPQLAGKDDRDLTRLAQYQSLERRKLAAGSADENGDDFLRHSGIKVFIDYDLEENIDRCIELINRTNQLNFTKQRLPVDAGEAKQEFLKLIRQPRIQGGLIHCHDNYGDHGCVGLYVILEGRVLKHFLFSCRVLGMGIEQWLYKRLGNPYLEIVGDVLSDPRQDGRNVDWIELVAEKKAVSQPEQTSSHTKKIDHFYVLGGCIMENIGHYLQVFSGNVVHEGNARRDGIDIRRTHTCFLAYGEWIANEKFLAAITQLGCIKEDFENGIFRADEKSAVVLLTGA